MPDQLSTGTATAHLSNMKGRAIMSARGHYFIIDSPPILDGPNEEINSVDVFLSVLASCSLFICEAVALEDNIRLDAIKVAVAGEFDPRAVCGEPVDSKFQRFRIKLSLTGPTQEQADYLANTFISRCPVYGTLVEAAPIDVQVELLP